MSLLLANAYQGSSGVVTPPESDYYSPQSGNITFSDDQFQDAVPGFAKTGFTMRNPNALVEFRTTLTDFSVKVGGNWSGFGEQSKVHLLVEDVYNQSISLTADNTTQTVAISTLSAGLKNIKLVNGYAAQSDFGGDINRPQAGVYVQGVVTLGDIEVRIPYIPSHRIVVDGMSITTAAGASNTLSGWLTKFKWIDGYNMTFCSYGAKALANNSNVFDSTKADNMVALHTSLMDGASLNTMLMDLHTNDFGLSGWQVSKATFKTRVTLYADKLNAARPDALLIWWLPLERTDAGHEYDTPNINGATLGDFKDAILEVAATRSSWFKTAGARTDVSSGNLPDGVHPNQTGHTQIYTTRLPEFEALL